jgi:hypothetical protein
VPLNELLITLTMWIGAATGQPVTAPPPIAIVPGPLLHYRYCETTAGAEGIDDCLSERFTSAAFLDSSTGTLYLSQRFKPTSNHDRANLLVQLARHAGEVALLTAGHTAKYEGHEDIIDCGIRFERATRELARAFLTANGSPDAEQSYLEVEDGMKPWSCSPAGAMQATRNITDPAS